MTTDPTSADDRAARLDALRRRRTGTPEAGTVESASPTAPRRRPHRRHAATGGRILAGSLSAAAALALMGAMAHATSPSTDAPTPTTAPGATAPTARAADVAAPAAPRVTPTAAAPVTTSRGS
jgi:hypothetical protein